MLDSEVVKRVNGIISEYNERLRRLNSMDSSSITYALRYLRYKREMLHIDSDGSLNIIEKHEKKLGMQEGILREAKKHLPEEVTTDFATLDDYIKSRGQIAFTIMEELKRQLKSFYVKNGLLLNAVRVHSPEELDGGVIPVSKGLLTQYEEEKGDFVFASSTDPSRNAYLARAFGKGMYGMQNETYFYPGKNLSAENGRLFVSKTGYIYYMNPDEFTPVVTMSRDKEGAPYFRFGEEWTIPRDVSIEDDVVRVEEFRDVTQILDHIQALSSTDQEIVSKMYSRDLSEKEKLEMLLMGASDGRVQYWNGILNRNPILRETIEKKRQEYLHRSVEEMKKETDDQGLGG